MFFGGKKLGKLLVSIGLCEGVGIAGSFFTTPYIDTWYVSLAKPVFTPPNFVFGPVWTLLYFLMGLSLYLFWVKFEQIGWRRSRKGFFFFGSQLALNFLWSYVFFANQSILGGLIVIFALIAFISATIYEFYGESRTAALLLVPYLLWTCFAAILNFSLFTLNSAPI